MTDTKMKPKYAGWYCNKCDFVHYNASQKDVDEHLKTHDEPDTKMKPDWFTEWKQIRDSGVDSPMSEFYDKVEALLFKQEEQHKAEMKDQELIIHSDGKNILKLMREIKQLKQQHREELQELLSEIDSLKVGATKGYILQRLEFMITNLLEQKGK